MGGREPDVIALVPAFSLRSDIGSFFSTSAATERVHPARATTTRRQPLPTIRLRCRFQATSDRPYSGVTPRAAAISGGIDQPTSHDRHQYPDLGSLER